MLAKPVIMVKETGMSSIVSQNDIGELIEFSEKSFENGLERLIKRKTEWPNMSERMKAIYKEQYSWDIMRRRLVNLYSEL